MPDTITNARAITRKVSSLSLYFNANDVEKPLTRKPIYHLGLIQYASAMIEENRRLIWDGCVNARHLGGFRAEGQGMTREVALIRSGNLSRLSAEGQTSVRQANVSAIIDVRSAYELKIEANPFAISTQASALPIYHHLPLMNEDDLEAMRLVNTAPSLLPMYQVMLERFTVNIAGIMTAIADASPGAVVVHCHAGKDRTGLVIALVLRLTGVSPEDIAQDYALSDLYLQSQYQEMLAQKTNLEERTILASQLTSKPETMTNLLQHIEKYYGGVKAYLKFCGLQDETLDCLTQRMLEPMSTP